jgi:UDP-3-O-[3-hydroxymyristoyl] glucosamine N-acyltransferase
MKTTVRQIAEFLGTAGPPPRDFPVLRAGPPTEVSGGMLTLVNRSGESLAALFATAPADVVVFTLSSLEQQAAALPQVFFFSANPRLDFCRVLNRYFTEAFSPGVAASAVVRTTIPLNPLVRIGDGCVITGDVTIGDRTVVEPNVVITGRVTIGSDVYIRSGAVIGQKGYGFERDESGMPVLFPQLGGVRIGDRVEIGAITTVTRGTLGDTVIADDSKIDDHVHVAHNVVIGPRCMVTAGVIFAGSVTLGCNVFVGVNATISNGIRVGDGARISLGAVVVRNVEPDTRVTGNFAEPHARFRERWDNLPSGKPVPEK